MKHIVSAMIGIGLLGLQGCAVGAGEGGPEDVSSEQGALSSSCLMNQGVFPTKASLAVAMGIELGRWDPLDDLENVDTKMQLKSTVTCLKNSCKNTKAILGQQYFTPDQNTFSSNAFGTDLWSAMSRQRNLIQNLTKNYANQLPPAHKLTLVGGPVSLGTATCGPHYVFQVDHLNGTAVTAVEAANMSNTLCFFGQDTATTGCGSNPFIGFAKTGNSCPSGRVCVAIDPTDGDNGSVTTTTAGVAPTYPMNRLYDPANSKLNSTCIKTAGGPGTMQSKCSAYPSTCGYLYCM